MRAIESRVKSYPEELNLDFRKGRDREMWLIASVLFAKPISAAVALRVAQLLRKEGIGNSEALIRTGWHGLVEILDLGGYVRYDFSTATRLLKLAEALKQQSLEEMYQSSHSPRELERRLLALPGVGPAACRIFLRELRGVWRVEAPICREARQAARRMALRLERPKEDERRLAQVEGKLVRLWLEWCKRRSTETCPMRDVCGCRVPKR